MDTAADSVELASTEGLLILYVPIFYLCCKVLLLKSSHCSFRLGWIGSFSLGCHHAATTLLQQAGDRVKLPYVRHTGPLM